MIIVDSSALAKYVLKENGWDTVEKHLATGKPATCGLALKEVANAIWKYAVIFKSYSKEVALEKFLILAKLAENVLEIEDERVYLREAFEIALKTRLTIYDTLFIAQALRHEAPLLTSDEKQASEVKTLGVDVILV